MSSPSNNRVAARKSFQAAGHAAHALVAAATVLAVVAPPPSHAFPTAAGQGPEYVIGPRDVIEVRAFNIDDLNVSGLRVSENGEIDLPLIGKVHAAGLTRDELALRIEEALKKYVREPDVFVNITEYRAQRFSVLGAVGSPGFYEMEGAITLLEALLQAGGVTLEEAAGPISVLRTGSLSTPFTIDAHELVVAGNPAFNVTVQPGDIINVVAKQAYEIYVYGQVSSQGPQELTDPITLVEAIALAGGLAERAAPNRIRILRTLRDGSRETLKINLHDIEEGKREDFPLQPGDIVIVPETWF